MGQTGGSRTGYHPFLLDICCVNDLATAFRGLARFLGRLGLRGQVAAGPRRFFAQRRPAQCDLSAKRRDDRYGLAITTYEMEAEKYIYRVYKYEL